MVDPDGILQGRGILLVVIFFNYFFLSCFVGLLVLERGLIDAEHVLFCGLAHERVHLLA